MPTDSRASGNCPERPFVESERSGVACAAGQAHTFAYSFKIDRLGHFIAYRGGVNIGGITFKPGGWIAYERHTNAPMQWTSHGRIKASSAAFDLWGSFAADQVKLCPENRPSDPPDNDGARLRRQMIKQDNEVRA